ncbi:uncharacterized protein LOC110443482 isoform X2 [Mizuhopecten yessoensis]|uniref:uncharacterized protein LOC110443482 isoform X2 n=1 Tax=Mizuhopecten yessoensis TaxID=6573 RepID=UPI000B45B97D|nr:uncharacterized protein LOC110443482 isoform X2 [Mizuhopecten yessoensis]
MKSCLLKDGVGALGFQVLSLVFELMTFFSCLLMLSSGLFEGSTHEECYNDGNMFFIIFYGVTGCMNLSTCFLIRLEYQVSSLDVSYYLCLTAGCYTMFQYFCAVTYWVCGPPSDKKYQKRLQLVQNSTEGRYTIIQEDVFWLKRRRIVVKH